MTILSSAPLQPDVNPSPEPPPSALTGAEALGTPLMATGFNDAERSRAERGAPWVSAALAVLAGVTLLQGAILVGLLLLGTLSVLLLAANRQRWTGLRRDSGGSGGGVPDVGSSEGSAHGQASDCGASDGGGAGCSD